MDILAALTFLLAPAYAIRFSLPHLPTDVLMVWIFLFWFAFFIWLLIKEQLPQFVISIKNIDRKLLVLVGLFFLSGLIGLFIHGLDRPKVGQFIVLFFQPIGTFFIAAFIFKQKPNARQYLLLTAYCLLALAGLCAMLQYFTLLGLPQIYWGNSVEPKRAVAFFTHPNFYALWSAPLLALLVPDLGLKIKDLKNNWHFISAWLLGAIGLLFSFSRAGWLGLAAAVVIYLFIAADKKIRKLAVGAVIVLAIIIVSVPNLRYRLLLPFYGEKSTVSRLSLWETGIKGVKESPIFGIGLNGFSRQWGTLNTDPGLTDTHNFPHNIFLDFWVETGLLGLASFVGVAYLYIYRGFKNRQNLLSLGVSLFLIALIVQGQIDNPYFKNDLALIFWMVLSLAV